MILFSIKSMCKLFGCKNPCQNYFLFLFCDGTVGCNEDGWWPVYNDGRPVIRLCTIVQFSRALSLYFTVTIYIFSGCTLFTLFLSCMLYFFCVALFHVAFLHVAFFSFCSLFLLHSSQVAIFSCRNLFMCSRDFQNI